jgi:hypothetical protein
LGALIRNSPGAIVGYMVYAIVALGLPAFLAFNQTWFHDAPGSTPSSTRTPSCTDPLRQRLDPPGRHDPRLAVAPSDGRDPQPASLGGQVAIRSLTLKQRVRDDGKIPFVGFFDAK